MTRACAFCQGPLTGRQTKFCSDAHRVAWHCANGSSPSAEPGKVREGLEAWLETIDLENEALVSHARMLADLLDRSPRNSPLHGRYTRTLELLIEADSSDRENPEVTAIMRHLAGACDLPAHGSAPVHCALCCTASDKARVVDLHRGGS